MRIDVAMVKNKYLLEGTKILLQEKWDRLKNTGTLLCVITL